MQVWTLWGHRGHCLSLTGEVAPEWTRFGGGGVAGLLKFGQMRLFFASWYVGILYFIVEKWPLIKNKKQEVSLGWKVSRWRTNQNCLLKVYLVTAGFQSSQTLDFFSFSCFACIYLEKDTHIPCGLTWFIQSPKWKHALSDPSNI